MILLDYLFALLLGTLQATVIFYIIVPHVIPEAVSANGMEALINVGVSFDVVKFDWTFTLRVSAVDFITASRRL